MQGSPSSRVVHSWLGHGSCGYASCLMTRSGNAGRRAITSALGHSPSSAAARRCSTIWSPTSPPRSSGTWSWWQRRRTRAKRGAGGRQGRRESSSLPRGRARRPTAKLAGGVVERRLHLFLGRRRRGPDAQLLPRDWDAKQQAEGVRMVEHQAAWALTGYLLVRGGVHQLASARALERFTLPGDLHTQMPTGQ